MSATAGLCPKDGRPCYVGGENDKHHRCGTAQCGTAIEEIGLKNCERCGQNHYDLTRPTVPGCPFKPQRFGPGGGR